MKYNSDYSKAVYVRVIDEEIVRQALRNGSNESERESKRFEKFFLFLEAKLSRGN